MVRLAPFAFSIRGSSLGRGEGSAKRTGGLSRAGKAINVLFIRTGVVQLVYGIYDPHFSRTENV